MILYFVTICKLITDCVQPLQRADLPETKDAITITKLFKLVPKTKDKLKDLRVLCTHDFVINLSLFVSVYFYS